MKTIVVGSLLGATVVWSELLALNDEIMAGFGTILIILSVTIERWANE